MVLNSDCVRDVLLAIESCGFEEYITLETLKNKLPNYNEEELLYTCLKLEEGNYLDLMTFSTLGMQRKMIKQINDITFAGHEFLNTIREDETWQKVKSTAKKAGVGSLKTLGDIAQKVSATVITAALQSHL